ncbi:TetR/AcrR family transcriptional regulator [Corynebacterium urinipleomorphum]|uniref:TetR/AcrR family transcriptional regulator n=1 Tax=Corynebacterium urinipleomorphum TaxID=1852380 RepID=UPI000B3560D4|nr:TetR/AcrR family transcriptional regulator [Corynebacterium urinipleomorphum]
MVQQGSGKGARRRLPVEQRRAQILDVAGALFAENGYNGVSTLTVAQACGVSEGLLFHHFLSKAEIYAAVVERRLNRLDEAMRNAVDGMPPNSPKRDTVRALIVTYLDHIAEEPLSWAAVTRGDTPAEAQFVGIERRDGVVDKLLALVGDRSIAVSGFLGFVEAVCLDWVDAGCPNESREPIIAASLGALEGALGDWG